MSHRSRVQAPQGVCPFVASNCRQAFKLEATTFTRKHGNDKHWCLSLFRSPNQLSKQKERRAMQFEKQNRNNTYGKTEHAGLNHYIRASFIIKLCSKAGGWEQQNHSLIFVWCIKHEWSTSWFQHCRSGGMIFASGARGPGLNSRSSPFVNSMQQLIFWMALPIPHSQQWWFMSHRMDT